VQITNSINTSMTRFLGCRGSSLNIVAILGVLMPGIMSVGYNAASLGGVLTFNTFEAQFPDIDVTHSENPSRTSTLQGTVVAVYAIGGFLGTFSCIWLGDILGRRRMIMAASIVQILGATLNATAYSLTQLIVSRVTIGVGTGAILATIPLWQSEISPAHRRGAHVVTKGVFSGIGCALALFLEFGMSFMKGSITWRLPSAFPMFLSLVILGFMFCLPESPRWLLCQNRVPEAREILAALENASADSDVVESRIKEVQSSLDLAGNKASLARLYNMGPQRTFHRAILAMGGMIFVQLTGSTVTTFYSKCLLYLFFENTFR
jgi:MFS family permease